MWSDVYMYIALLSFPVVESGLIEAILLIIFVYYKS